MNLFDAIPSNFFNMLSSQSNGQIYSGVLLAIYDEYEHEISYRIPRERIRDAVSIYLLDNHIHIDEPDVKLDANAGDIAMLILRKMGAPEVGWIMDEIDDATYGHNIVMTEQGVKLAEFLENLMKPERVEFSSFIFDVYNRLENEKQWRDNPYVNALESIFGNARALSRALKKLSTFIRDIIERMVKEESLESLTNNLLDYCNGDFIREYARLNKQQNIHIYRNYIISRLQKMETNRKLMEKMIHDCMDEENVSEAEARDRVTDMFHMTKKFLKDDYDRIMHEIQHKITVYLQIAVGRARFLQNRDPNTRGYVEQSLKYLIDGMEEIGIKEVVSPEVQELFAFETYDFIDRSSLRYPGKTKTIRKSEETELVSMTDEEREAALAEQRAAAYNPYSKTAMRQYILDHMHGENSITSDELPLEQKEEMLATLSAAAYGDENGFDVEVLEGYYETHNLRLRRFLMKKKGNFNGD